MSSINAQSSKVKDRELLGQGRFGQVYRGVFRDKPVAIKKIQLTLLGPGEDKEVSIMKELHHPNVLRLIGAEDKGEFRFAGALTLLIHVQKYILFRFLYLELCEGTLEDFLKKKYCKEIPQDSMCLYQMASGLRYIHSLNYIHRDIKPENILIHKQDSQVQLKISDFGNCKGTRASGSYSLSGVKGTPIYLAPEMLSILDNEDVVSERRATKACDVFSLGCVFYKFLTRGTHPFGEDIVASANIAMGTSQLDSMYLWASINDVTLHEEGESLASVARMYRTHRQRGTPLPLFP